MPEGYVGNLTQSHHEKLQQLWQSFFSVCDRATGTKRMGNAGEVTDWGVDTEAVEKKMGGFNAARNAVKNSGIDRDDSAKDSAQKRMEEGNMEKLLSTYGPEALRNTFWSLCQSDHPDTTMLRFLRARKWDVDRATAMMASTLKWRLDTGVDHMSHNGDLFNDKEIPKYIDQQATGKVYAMGCNVHEQPVCYVHFKKHLIWGQPSASMKKFIICQMESWRLLFVPPNDKMVILFDCTGFGPQNLDMPNFLYVLQCLQSYFPECLAVLYLHNAPWILKQAWQLVKGLLDPVVRSKVVFTSSTEDLQENIPEDRLLEFVGGDVDQKFVWNDPKEGENDLTLDDREREARWSQHMKLTKSFEEVTRNWISAAQAGDRTVTHELNEKRRTLAKRLRISQFDYEPFWRGKTVHHRNGDLVTTNPGIIQWRYHLKDGTKVRQIIGQRQCKKTLVRELQEIEAGASVDFAEKRTEEMLADESWGHWSTMEDLPPKPTGFKDNKLVYDSIAPAYQEKNTEPATDNTITVPASAATAAPAKLSPNLSATSKTDVEHDSYPSKIVSSRVVEKDKRDPDTIKVTDYKSKSANGTTKKTKKKFFSNIKSIIAA